MFNVIKNFIINHIPFIRKKIEEKEAAELEAKKWKRIATLDGLTGLPNKLCFDMYWKSIRQKGTVVIADIDYFKKINDTYGHAIGNDVLIRVARILEKSNDYFVSRYGGEEFLMAFPDNVNRDRIIQKMEKLRKEIELKMKDYNITISIGISLVGNDLRKIFTQADKALYHSKKTGRNRTTRYSTDIDDVMVHTEDDKGEIQKRDNISYV